VASDEDVEKTKMLRTVAAQITDTNASALFFLWPFTSIPWLALF